MKRLGVNIDHVATVRNARGSFHPDPLSIAKHVIDCGAHSITIHLREDRRHIQFEDIKIARKNIKTKLNLEMAATEEMCVIANQIKPDFICIVPEKRQELTTEGGLDVKKYFSSIRNVVNELRESNAVISLFIEPDIEIISLAKDLGVGAIELHTGKYAESKTEDKIYCLEKIKKASDYANNISLVVNAGHGLDYTNVKEIARIDNINELNIGHSIIAESIFLGLSEAIKKMKNLIESTK